MVLSLIAVCQELNYLTSKVVLCREVICTNCLFEVPIKEEWFRYVCSSSGVALSGCAIVTSSIVPYLIPFKGEGQPSPFCHDGACPVHPWLLLLLLL